MRGDGKLYAVLLLLLICAFGFGARFLVSERFERGDSYPPCSSFRSDPGGMRVLYLALDRVPDLRVRRNFTDISRLPRESGATWFFLGVDARALQEITAEDLREFEEMAARGNRIVVALTGTPESAEQDEDAEGTESDEPAKKPGDALLAHWNLAIDTISTEEEGESEGVRAVRTPGEAGVPESITLRSVICFSMDHDAWQTVYTAQGMPVVVERVFGKGSVVLLADPYPASNGAMKNERHPDLILRLLGENREVVFDESHLGVAESPGVIRLMAKYRMTPFLAALAVLALLYFWKNAVPLVPYSRMGHTPDAGVSTDRDSLGGLVNLLRRSVPRENLLEVCFREWTRSFSREFPPRDRTRARMKGVVEDEGRKMLASRDAATGYARLAKILAERKRI